MRRSADRFDAVSQARGNGADDSLHGGGRSDAVVVLVVVTAPLKLCQFFLARVRLREETDLKKTRFSEEQIIAVLREQEGGMKTADVCRKHRISSATLYTWEAIDQPGSSASRSTGFTFNAVASSNSDTIVGFRRPRSRSEMYCCEKPDSSANRTRYKPSH